MKKGLCIFVVVLVMLSSLVYAVSYGSKITRIQTFPGEKIKDEIEQAKSDIGAEKSDIVVKLEQLSADVSELKLLVDKVSSDFDNARTETNVQMSNLVSVLANVKSEVSELSSVKGLRDELPPLLEQPREIITPKVLVNFSVLNLALLLVVIGLVLFVRRDHEMSHKIVPHSHPELHDYIKQHIKKGVHINTIRHQLISHDWDAAEVDEAVRQVRES